MSVSACNASSDVNNSSSPRPPRASRRVEGARVINKGKKRENPHQKNGSRS